MKVRELIEFLSKLDGEKELSYDCGEYMHEFYDLRVFEESEDSVVVVCGE